MRHRFQQLKNDERGQSLVFIAAGFMAFMAATTLAIDVGMLMTARSQAQNSADAGALAGATALYFNNFKDRSSTGPAVTSALSAARSNAMMGQVPSVGPADVTFPNDLNGKPTRVAVQVQRSTARGNAVPTFIGAVFGINRASIFANATAEASQANAETCVMPFTIPDKWEEHQTPLWDPTDTFDMYNNKKQLLPNPDVYRGPGSANPTGYSYANDIGLELVLKASNGSKIAPSEYNPWDLPGSVGASDYRNNIASCNTNIMKFGDNMPPETGNMVGPTAQGMADRIAQDPSAYWDTTCNCVKSPYGGKSPRIVIIPLYDPVAYAQGQQSGKNATFNMVNFIGFFLEQMQGYEVKGRLTPISGLFSNSAGPAPAGAFPVVIRLVQ